MGQGIACINIDLDALPHYLAIHGLGADALPAGGHDAVNRLAINRFLALADGLPSTLFAVGRDLGAPGKASLRRAVQLGHEVGNHTYWHDYALATACHADLAADLHRGAEVIETACGIRPRGFRAPGYAFTADMYRCLIDQGYAYGSSVFPAAPYYAAKAGVMALRQLQGSPSAALLDSPRVLTAPRLPYMPDPDSPYRRGRGPVPELPITVEPLTRFPFIGTFAATLPEPFIDLMYRRIARLPFLNFELHGADLIDGSDGVGPALLAVQRDLRVPAPKKLARLRKLLARIRNDFEVITLLDASKRVP